MRKYHRMDPRSETRFARAVSPLVKADFHKKRVLDAGCGNGEKSYWAVRWGSREVVGIDADAEAIAITSKTLEPFSNARAEQKDLNEEMGDKQFDLVYSLGVISRLEDPASVIQNLTKALKNRAVLLVSVPKLEGSQSYAWLIGPFKKYLFSRIPEPALHILSFVFAIPLWVCIKILFKTTPYFGELSRYSFLHFRDSVFLEISAPCLRFYTQAEAQALLSSADFEEVHVFQPANQVEWTVVGLKK